MTRKPVLNSDTYCGIVIVVLSLLVLGIWFTITQILDKPQPTSDYNIGLQVKHVDCLILIHRHFFDSNDYTVIGISDMTLKSKDLDNYTWVNNTGSITTTKTCVGLEL